MGFNEELEEFKAFCKSEKAKRKTSGFVLSNPFSRKFAWCGSAVMIEVDKSPAIANKSSIVYDTVNDHVYKHLNGAWIRIDFSRKQ